MSRALSQRANQKPSRPASKATAMRSILHGQGQERPAGYKLAARTYAPESGLHSDHLRNRLTAGESASVLAAVKDKPAVAAEDAAILDRRCARRRERNAVGAEECSRRGSNKKMDYKDHVFPLTR